MTRGSLALVLLLSGCAARPIHLPEGPGRPLPDFQTVFDRATAACRGVRTLTAELRLAGHAGRARLRGRVVAGFAAPGLLRLEGVAPFGAPAFIMVAGPEGTTLLLPRDNRVLSGEPPAAVLDALAGVSVAPDDLRALLAGCFASNPSPVAGRLYGSWAALDLDLGGTLYLRRAGDGWRVGAGVRGALHVEYEMTGTWPERVRLLTNSGPVGTDLTVSVSQVETNVTLGQDAFKLTVPADAAPLSLEELRNAGPLGEAGGATP